MMFFFWRVTKVRMRDFVSRDGAMTIDMNIMSILPVLVIEGSMDQGISGNVVRLVSVDSEASADVMNSWEEVECAPISL